MISDNLAGLFGAGPAGPAPDSSLRQGRLLTFDPSTGLNTVLVGTTVLTNVPMLQTGAEVGLVQGNTVLLAQIGYTYLILGRITSPNGSTFASASQAYAEAATSAANFALPSTYSTICQVSLTVPTWANTASVIGNFSYNAFNNAAADSDMATKMNIDGEDSGSGLGGVFSYGAKGHANFGAVGQSVKHTVTPGSTVLVKGLAKSLLAFTADPNNLAVLNCLAIFTKS